MRKWPSWVYDIRWLQLPISPPSIMALAAAPKLDVAAQHGLHHDRGGTTTNTNTTTIRCIKYPSSRMMMTMMVRRMMPTRDEGWHDRYHHGGW
mmetsp:Transcript_9662/g.27497  ORF Transcript_9662/g.27497 Transcript_9662/m.27497 type:complete len:93 (+) Transcript_9662:351-629(+)